jgi:hypothetical protein
VRLIGRRSRQPLAADLSKGKYKEFFICRNSPWRNGLSRIVTPRIGDQ